MCGRYTLSQAPKKGVTIVRPSGGDAPVAPRYNIAPTQFSAVIPQHDSKRIHMYQWGLIPHWAKDRSWASKTINARAETLTTKASFRDAIHIGRCLVLADGFYEWKKEGKHKQPYWIHLKSREVFAFAGISSVWRDEEGKQLYTYSIITIPANSFMQPLHHRMPVILKRQDARKWLQQDQALKEALNLLQPYPDDEMNAYPVSRMVNQARNEHPSLIRPHV